MTTIRDDNKGDRFAAKTEIRLHRIYVKNSLFEATTLTSGLLENLPHPMINLQVFTNNYLQESSVYEVVLTLQITAKHNDSLLWRVQLQQAGLYTLKDFAEEAKQQILNGFCMNQLYPYACVQVNQMVIQGGFLPVYLSPMNFEQLYYERQKKAEEEKTSSATVA